MYERSDDKAFSILIFADTQSGLGQTTVSITQDDQVRVVSSLNYSGKTIHQKTVPITIDPIALKLHDGPAMLTITAVDQSLWKNTATISKMISIDVIPPQIFLLTPTNHINPGGTCMVLYRTSKPAISTGVRVEDLFYPAYPISLAGKPAYIAYFALPSTFPLPAETLRSMRPIRAAMKRWHPFRDFF